MSVTSNAMQWQATPVSVQQQPLSNRPMPCVIPQTSKSFRGAFFSPFIRAYAPQLEANGISKEDLVTYIDGLNECFVAHPAFQGVGIVGGVMTMAHGIHPVQWAGMGLQLASGAASSATSYGRTRAYVKASNADLFHPAGLHVNILKTKDMMAKVGYPEEKLKLPPLEQLSSQEQAVIAREQEQELTSSLAPSSASQDDPRMRRMRALDGYVMPLDYNVPAQVMPEGMLSKMGAAHSKRLAAKQDKKLMKERREGDKKHAEKVKEAEKKQREGDKEVAKLEQKLLKKQSKLSKKIAKDGDKAVREFEKEEAKIRKEIDKEIAKRDKDVAKEMKHAGKEKAKGTEKEDKIAQKIRWIVISAWDEEEHRNEDSEEAASGFDESDDERTTIHD